MAGIRARFRESGFWLFFIFCLFAGSRWLIENILPQAASTLTSSAGGCVAGAITLFSFDFAKRRRQAGLPARALRGVFSWRSAVCGSLVLTAPTLSGWMAARHLSADTAVLALALTPVVAAIARSGNDPGEGVAGLLWPCLVALSGMLLLLPVPDLDRWRVDLALLALPVMVGLGAAGTVEPGRQAAGSPGQDGGLPWQAGSLVLAAGTFWLLEFLLTGRAWAPLSLVAMVLDGSLFALSLIALSRLGTLRWSAQFLLVPWITVAEGVVTLRPAMNVRSWAGLAMLLAGGAYPLLDSRFGAQRDASQVSQVVP